MIPEHFKAVMREYTAALQRGIPSITDEQLEEFLNDAVTAAKKELVRERCLEPFARLIIPTREDATRAFRDSSASAAPLAGGKLEMLHIPLPFPDDPAGKTASFNRLRVVCRVLAAMAVVIVSDGWTLWDEKTKHFGTTPEGCDYVLAHGSPAAAAAGFGTLKEVVNASIQTKSKMVAKTIPYDRCAKGGILTPNGSNPMGVRHTIEFPGNVAVFRMPQSEEVGPPTGNIVLIYEAPDAC